MIGCLLVSLFYVFIELEFVDFLIWFKVIYLEILFDV